MYDIREHLAVLTPAKGSRTKHHCPICNSDDLDISKDGAYNCFSGGCEPKDIRDAIDRLEGKPEWKPEGKPEKFVKSARPKSQKDYFYPDRDGSQLIKVSRIDDGSGKKKFWQKHWDGSNWIAGNPDKIKKLIPIYRQAEVQKAIERGESIFICEGESTADALWALEIAATTTIGGCGGYANYGNYSEDLKGARLVIAPDRDANGIKYISNFERDFSNQIEGYYLAGTQDLWKKPEGGMDIGDDIIDHGYTKEQLLDRIITTEKYSELTNSSAKESQPATDKPVPEKNYESLARRLGFSNICIEGGKVSSKLNRLILDLFDLTGDALRFNLMSREYELHGELVDLNNARTFVSENLNLQATTEDCILAIHRIASRYSYHPVKEYLELLKGNVATDFSVLENIATHFLGNPDPLANKMMAKKLVAAVARVMKPGCKDDTLLVLQGKQGAGKSTFLNVLAGADWFCDDIRDLDNKDELAKLSRNWILELAEVDYLMGRKEVESFKRFLSTTTDTYRPPYGRANIRIDRTCSFFATTNKTEFLADPTGDRRYWVVEVKGKMDCTQVAAYRDTIWATALAAYERGDTWWLDGEDEAERSDSHSKYRDSDPWVAVILGIDGKLPTTPHSTGEYTLTDQIFDRLELTSFQRGRRESNRVKTAMLELGFEYKVLWLAGKAQKAWYRDLPLPNNSSLPNNNLLGKACNSVGEALLPNLPNLPNLHIIENEVIKSEVIEVPQIEVENINIEIPPIQELLGNVSKLGKSGTEKHLQALPNNNLLGKGELLGKELSGKDFKIGDRVRNEKINKTGSIKDIRTRKTPKGSEFTQYLVDFGTDKDWYESVVLTLEVA